MVTMSLRELIDLYGGEIKTGPFGTVLKASEYGVDGGGGAYVVSVGEVGHGHLRLHDRTPRVGLGILQRLPEYVVRSGDILVARKGAVDRSFWVSRGAPPLFLGSDALRIRLSDEVSSRYLAYQLRSPSSRQWLLRHAAGTTMLSLSGETLGSLPVRWPSRAQQAAVGSLLGALDDKIAANRTIEHLAEELLAAQWSAVEAEIEDSDEFALTDLVEVNPTLSLRHAEPVYVDMQKLPTAGLMIHEWDRREARGGARFQNGDTLLARITPCLENRKLGLVSFLEDGDVAVGSTEYIVLRPRPGYSSALPFFVAASERFREFAIKHMLGTSGRQRLSPTVLSEYRLSLNVQALGRFSDTAAALLPKLAAASAESRALAELRDTLLGPLMSGRLKIKDAERVVEEVV